MNLDGFDEALSAQIVAHAASKTVQPAASAVVDRDHRAMVLALTLGGALLLSLACIPPWVFQ